ncbi:phage major tail protein, TP901-1 family [Sphingobacterium sp. UT-1RO-CII-1]|uniref:phage major tail protein, TP901-1 family n=1 Tax=Sphingobacterium sp. UT-1RO-CII-1 TaxID=2995225 RepID=UPI00227CB660|nr:phage major tail protein, TP901-1 family [Sphingobacterium sp. UT-1RO-CII-1]MCY4779491.1 phage major tail protein, TP901-1 family [Sphingobacterium sp. UT-1RO-CII-1]
MAERFENGKDYLLFIKDGTPTPEWLTLACLTTNGFEGSRDSIDTSSKCSGAWGASIAGNASWTMSGDGMAIDSQLQASEASFDKLFELFKSGKTFPVKIAKVGGSYVRYGEAWISSYNETQGNNEAFTFSVTLQGVGEPMDEEPTP